MKATITPEMRLQASIESKKRDMHIKHHFEVAHLTHEERDEVGFLGEFACCTLLNINWQNKGFAGHTKYTPSCVCTGSS